VSTLTSASTLAQVNAAYDDNASYEEDVSVAKAKAFITACRFLLRRVPKRAIQGGRGGGNEVEIDPAVVADAMKRAQQWLSTQPVSAGGSGGAIYKDFRDIRQ
jgi:hypothetical protein